MTRYDELHQAVTSTEGFFGTPGAYFSIKQRRAIASEARACLDGCESCKALKNVCFKNNQLFFTGFSKGNHFS
jgi:hypothetical protein